MLTLHSSLAEAEGFVRGMYTGGASVLASRNLPGAVQDGSPVVSPHQVDSQIWAAGYRVSRMNLQVPAKRHGPVALIHGTMA